ncbi:MAG: hypothetical protein DRG34_06140, partial [Deltaproteobacteria bacterium]
LTIKCNHKDHKVSTLAFKASVPVVWQAGTPALPAMCLREEASPGGTGLCACSAARDGRSTGKQGRLPCFYSSLATRHLDYLVL